MKLYKSEGKCDDSYQYKYILKAAVVSPPQELTDNSKHFLGILGTMKKPSARKYISQFWAILGVNQKLLFVYWDMQKQITRLSEQEVAYGLALISK